MYHGAGFLILILTIFSISDISSQLPGPELDISSYLDPDDGYLAGNKTPVFFAKSNSSEKFGVQYELIPDVLNVDTFTSYNKSDDNFINIDDLFAIDENPSKLSLPEPELGISSYLDPDDDYLARDKTSVFFSTSDSSKNVALQYEAINGAVIFNNKSDDKLISIDNLLTMDEKFNKSLFKILDNLKFNSHSKNNSDESPPLAMYAVPEDANKTNILPEVIHPQLLIVMEYSLFDIFHQNVIESITYILSYWNAVDLRYRSFQNPKVRLNIAGIILAKDAGATPYVNESLVRVRDRQNLLFNNRTLESFARQFYSRTIYDKEKNILSLIEPELEFDAVITMTAQNMCEFIPSCIENNEYTCPDHEVAVATFCPTVGSAYYTGAGAYDPEEKKMEAFGLIEDKGSFATVLSAAHELGHLLGASHSLDNENNCPIDDGFIMSYRIQVQDTFFVWSDCSLNSIRKFLLLEERAKTLFNQPDVGTKIRRILPGRDKNRHEICKRLGYADSFCNDRMMIGSCVQLYCRKEGDIFCTPVVDSFVSEGSACGKQHICINGKCIDKTENTVRTIIGESYNDFV